MPLLKTRLQAPGSRLQVGLLVALGLVGCFSPQFGDGTQPCADDHSCPPGLTCGGDNRCHVGAFTVDAASIDGHADAAPDAPVPCGNGRLDPGEMCDPAIAANMAGHCPALSDCNDGDVCTTDSVQGSAATCDAVCHHETITTCGPSDSCCPGGVACNHNQDPDCSPSCGNGAVESGETCDKAIAAGQQGACPTLADCNDNDACTSDSIVGAADTCTAQCLHTTISTCGLREGCCPSNCNANLDPDCSPVCGNGTVELGETCDPPSSCPQDQTACDDNDPCTVDSLAGDPNQCTAACQHTPINTCAGGDNCCAPGCNAINDTDCQPRCGNGVVEAGETCDPPSSCPQNQASCNDNNSCTTDTFTGSAANCTALCSHSTISACNNASNDGCCPSGCNTTNDRDCNPVCGNRVVESGEQCDICIIKSGQTCPPSCAGNCVTAATGWCPTAADCNDSNPCTTDTLQNAGTCTAQCIHTPVTTCSLTPNGCCPTGCNANNDRDCSAVCGNGVVEPGENCDTAIGPGLMGHCPSSSTDCDDGNGCTTDSVSGSNCTAQCTHTTFSCNPGIDGCCPSGCDANNDGDCSPICGNGVLESGEFCDTAIPQGNFGACPTSCPPSTQPCTQNTLQNGGTCFAECVSTSSTQCTLGSHDNCCTTNCSSANDSDCNGTWSVTTLASNVLFQNNTTCVNIPAPMVAGHWYVITTCGPSNPALGGAGDTTLTLIDPFGTQVGFDDDCYDASWIPLSAGWNCQNGNGSSYASCVADQQFSGSPTGYHATVTGTYTVCLKAFSTCTVSLPTTCRANVYMWQN